MKKEISFILFATLILLSSCTPRIAQNIKQCKTTDDLRRTFGPPNKILDNGSAGEIWLYSETWIRSTQGRITVDDNTATWKNPSTLEYDKYVRFWVQRGNIYRWETSGHQMQAIPKGVIIGVGISAVWLIFTWIVRMSV
jgi:hypothetical protein